MLDLPADAAEIGILALGNRDATPRQWHEPIATAETSPDARDQLRRK